MRDRIDCCAKCLVSFDEEPRHPKDEDYCWWCKNALTDVQEWLLQDHEVQTDQTEQENEKWLTP